MTAEITTIRQMAQVQGGNQLPIFLVCKHGGAQWQGNHVITIRLERSEWCYDPDAQLGPAGGFGVVYAGEGTDVGPVAVKRLNISADDAAHRELRVAAELAGKSLTRVIPIYDAGEDAESGSYYVVMARAERSLQDEIRSREMLSDPEASQVLLQVAEGLAELGSLVHRDLKPGNVLLHKGTWKVADCRNKWFKNKTRPGSEMCGAPITPDDIVVNPGPPVLNEWIQREQYFLEVEPKKGELIRFQVKDSERAGARYRVQVAVVYVDIKSPKTECVPTFDIDVVAGD